MKNLFNKGERYTKEGIALSLEVSKALRPVYREWSEEGFSLRGISHVIISEVISLECELVLRKAVEKRKSKA